MVVTGLALGAVYVPCAGPVLAAITVAGAPGRIGVGTVVLTLAFAVGTSIPLLGFALAGRRSQNGSGPSADTNAGSGSWPESWSSPWRLP